MLVDSTNHSPEEEINQFLLEQKLLINRIDTKKSNHQQQATQLLYINVNT